MKQKTKESLEEAYNYCLDQDKSMEYTLQYCQDVTKVDLDCVLSFIEKLQKDTDCIIVDTKDEDKYIY